MSEKIKLVFEFETQTELFDFVIAQSRIENEKLRKKLKRELYKQRIEKFEKKD